jgi:hypothetical protein
MEIQKPKIRKQEVIKISIPQSQLEMIRVLQKSFNYEVKGTMYFNDNNVFDSFSIRTDSSEIYSSGDSSWSLFFHTHPNNTAKKYGIRYFSPPSVMDVMEIYEYNYSFLPTNLGKKGETSIIFTNEGIYLLQVNRSRFTDFIRKIFKTENVTLDQIEEYLNNTFTKFMVKNIKTEMQKMVPHEPIDMTNPQISKIQYHKILKKMSKLISSRYGFDMHYYSWDDIRSKKKLSFTIYDFHISKSKV